MQRAFARISGRLGDASVPQYLARSAQALAEQWATHLK